MLMPHCVSDLLATYCSYLIAFLLDMCTNFWQQLLCLGDIVVIFLRALCKNSGSSRIIDKTSL